MRVSENSGHSEQAKEMIHETSVVGLVYLFIKLPHCSLEQGHVVPESFKRFPVIRKSFSIIDILQLTIKKIYIYNCYCTFVWTELTMVNNFNCIGDNFS